MPELPEVETVIRQIQSQISGEEIVAVQKSGLNLRKKLGCTNNALKGQKIKTVSRWGKKILINLSKETNHLDISLGMTGMLRVAQKGSKKLKHDHVSIKFKNGHRLVYNDPRRFGWVSFNECEFEPIGWDPLLSQKREFRKIVEQASRSDKNIYSFLMDQKYIVGLGNIYVQEILFKSRVSPFRITSSCSLDEMEEIRKHTKLILKKSLNHGGSTILSYTDAEGKKGAYQNKLNVYGKKKAEPCVVCQTSISHVMRTRSISHCPNCQK